MDCPQLILASFYTLSQQKHRFPDKPQVPSSEPEPSVLQKKKKKNQNLLVTDYKISISITSFSLQSFPHTSILSIISQWHRKLAFSSRNNSKARRKNSIWYHQSSLLDCLSSHFDLLIQISVSTLLMDSPPDSWTRRIYSSGALPLSDLQILSSTLQILSVSLVQVLFEMVLLSVDYIGTEREREREKIALSFCLNALMFFFIK